MSPVPRNDTENKTRDRGVETPTLRPQFWVETTCSPKEETFLTPLGLVLPDVLVVRSWSYGFPDPKAGGTPSRKSSVPGTEPSRPSIIHESSTDRGTYFRLVSVVTFRPQVVSSHMTWAREIVVLLRVPSVSLLQTPYLFIFV